MIAKSTLIKIFIMRFFLSILLVVLFAAGALSSFAQKQSNEVLYFTGTKQVSYTRTATEFGCIHKAFNRDGKEIWSQEDVRQSYSVSSTLSFYPDNLLKRAKVHSNPGADINWYDTVYEWDSLGRITLEEHLVRGITSSVIYTTYDADGTPRQVIGCSAPGLY